MDFTDIKISVEKYSSEIIDYDYLIELLNNYMDEKTPENEAAIKEHVASSNSVEELDLRRLLEGILAGHFHKHFTSQSFNDVIKEIHKENQELELNRWAYENGYNSEDILEAYHLFIPGVELKDNPSLNSKINEINIKLDLKFKKKKELKDKLIMKFQEMDK
ncbi:hypothetical protein XA3_02100 [Xylocopilactobacillus apicola]|uniref:Type I restriction enzyme R protein C-terminal domain-containing protein n=2 Tax=Xylocopilactobacillus apicola TaxID=2932184 RepID=A0AAU9DPN3_9LACO|nr:hypothetical protein XA3_02100 [Xylocopilactobacillus apicola]